MAHPCFTPFRRWCRHQGGAPSGALRRRRTRAGGRPPVGSGSRHGPDRLHRFQKISGRGRTGGGGGGAVPAVISSPAHCGAPGSWTFARKALTGRGRGRRKERPRPGGHQRSQYGYYTTIFAARASIFNQVCGLCTGEPSGCLLRCGSRGGTSGYGLCELTQGT